MATVNASVNARAVIPRGGFRSHVKRGEPSKGFRNVSLAKDAKAAKNKKMILIFSVQ
jgi:hypothetical protein